MELPQGEQRCTQRQAYSALESGHGMTIENNSSDLPLISKTNNTKISVTGSYDIDESSVMLVNSGSVMGSTSLHNARHAAITVVIPDCFGS